MGFSKLTSNMVKKRFQHMRDTMPKNTKGYHRKQKAIDKMEQATLSGDTSAMEEIVGELKTSNDTFKYGNSAFMKNPSNPSKYQNKGTQELTRTSRSGTGHLASDGDYWVDLPEGMSGTVVKKL